MKSKDIREKFLRYFESKGHLRLPGSSLIPAGDETLLFTNAGMVQFKSVFTGETTPPAKRATTCQKCLRAGGKHNDLENVGRTKRHHTFFEMLGNFSFGDYFKQEAIEYAWELITREYSIDPKKLYITVFKEDNEARELWKKITSFPEERIIAMGEKDNFWSMGEIGPCGPCSEILYDQGEKAGCGKPSCGPGCDCDRFLEIWNLVFMEFEKTPDEEMKKLPHPSIDTGMGLERICAVLQGVQSNYETDLFSKIISDAKRILKDDLTSLRVVADHSRAIAFLIADGVYPSNEGRGYVLRRIMRRGVRFGWKEGVREPFLYKLCDTVIEEMGDVYPELKEKRDTILKITKIEEEKFFETIDRGIETFYEEIKKTSLRNSKVLSGEAVFKLYDTYGFPPDLTALMAEEKGFTLDLEAFEQAMAEQKERSRRVREEKSSYGQEEIFRKWVGFTSFTGYEKLNEKTSIVAIIKDGKEIMELEEGEEAEMIIEKNPFYGESGGQVGDTGWIYFEGGKARVLDAKKKGEVIILKGRAEKGKLAKGLKISAQVDEERRLSIMRNHTATHLLHSALRKILGDHVRQSGSLVDEERLRFDFSHHQALTPEEIQELEETVNKWILDNRPVSISFVPYGYAKELGALAFFDEKYGDVVRVVTVERVSRELCGGTHCSRTGDIGAFSIISESSVASGVRRIIAVTGENFLKRFYQMRSYINSVMRELNSEEGLVLAKVKNLKKKIKEQEKTILELREKLLSGAGKETYQIEKINGVNIITGPFIGIGKKELGNMADKIKKENSPATVFFLSHNNDSVEGVCSVSEELTEKLNASELLKKALRFVQGGGGGRKDFAQGGGKDPEGIEKSIEEFKKEVINRLKD